MTTYASDGSVKAAPTTPTTDDVPTEPVLDVEAVDETPPIEPAPVDDSAVDGEVIDADAATDVAIPDADPPWAHEPDWKYDEVEYKGDMLAFRAPTANALNALYLASSTCGEEFVLKATNQFVKNHLSPKTIERVLERMLDPDDDEFTDNTVWSDLLKLISEIGGARAIKEAEALAAVTAGKGK